MPNGKRRRDGTTRFPYVRPQAGPSSVLHSIPFVPRLVFFYPLKSKNEARHSLRLQSALPSLFDPPTAALQSPTAALQSPPPVL
ncbi:hypothetical protein AVEN_46181-1 [Araneus ventricosus]|uniref:Uncharacterized protein n=1 Tax=Araneus ventricosus TaxID=182803 RepID=A0A4Y2E6C2_ARAVE|nr:hypothetical protein AVEN_46181-1 [Araneus ventricosus]